MNTPPCYECKFWVYMEKEDRVRCSEKRCVNYRKFIYRNQDNLIDNIRKRKV